LGAQISKQKGMLVCFLDLRATSRAAPEKDKQDLDNTEATKKMLLKHNLQIAAQEMNIVPGIHSALVSIPKLADAGYMAVLTKNGAAIYDDNTTAITGSNLPILESDRCQHTGMRRLNLDPKNTNTHSPDDQHATPDMINAIFDLPSSLETFLWYHASARFPPKETLIDTISNGNYATWPKLMGMLINQYNPDLDEIVTGHLKGQHQGIRSTKQKALEKIIENETVMIKIKGKKSPFHHIPINKTHQAFFCIEDLSNLIHTNQTGTFPFTSQ
jgi:hypothetical protein